MVKKMSETSVQVNDANEALPFADYAEKDVRISDIVRDGRYASNYRKHTDDEIRAAAEDIKVHGLLTPPWTVQDRGGRLHLAAGEKRIKALELLGEDTVRVRVYDSGAFGGIQKTSALLRAIENHRTEATFADRVRSVRQLSAARVSASEIASTWGIDTAYVQSILRWDSKLPPGWEDKLTKNVADRVAAAEDPAAAYAQYVADGSLPAKRENPGRGRGAKAASLKAKLFSVHPWAEKLPWDSGIVKLTSEEHLTAFSALCARLESLAKKGALVPRQKEADAPVS
jgi:hypothetical protein